MECQGKAAPWPKLDPIDSLKPNLLTPQWLSRSRERHLVPAVSQRDWESPGIGIAIVMCFSFEFCCIKSRT